MEKTVNTVRGPMKVKDIGVTLTHEHLWFDVSELYKRAHPEMVFSEEEVTAENRARVLRDLHSVCFEFADNLHFRDVDLICRELEPFKAAGGKTIFEVSCLDLDRNPEKLREISEKSGVNVVMGGSYYWFPSLDDRLKQDILEKGKNWLADVIIREFTDGVGDTGIRPGVIGEVGNGDYEGTGIIYRACAIAQRETGAPMICHSPSMEVLDIAEEEGADLSKIVMGHWSTLMPMEEAFKRGAFVSIDQFGMNFPGIEDDDSRINGVMLAFEKGYEKQLILSQDMCWKVRLKQFGGDGYAQIFEQVVPKMKARGLSDEQISRLFTDNVRRLLS